MLKKISLFAVFLITAGFSKGQLTSTNLPIVILTTSNVINDSSQVQGDMKIVANSSGLNSPTDAPAFSGMVGLRYRGNTTYPKKSLSIETWSAPNISLNTSLLGMPTENDWVLLSAYVDRSLTRDLLTSQTVQKMGRYAPRMKFCEVILNNQYQGIFLFGEKIKRDSARVDIATLTNIDISGENLTGGYIFTVDGGNNGWSSGFLPPFGTTQTIKFQIEEPDPSDILPIQKSYITSYVDSFEIAMSNANFQDTLIGWRKFAGINSFVDFLIINEFSKNLDAYRKNSFLYKDKSSKLRAGPVWGFDIAYKNTVDCQCAADTGWAYNLGASCGTESRLAPFWWSKLTTDTAFMRELKCEYSDYRKPGNALDTTVIFSFLDSVNTYLNANQAVSRNFVQWPIWGVPLVNEPTPMATDYATELANMKNYIKARIAWLDSKWYITSGCPSPIATQNIMSHQTIKVYPNPANNYILVDIKTDQKIKTQIEILNLQGSVLKSVKSHNNQTSVNIQSLTPGLYYMRISSESGMVIHKFIKE